MDDGTICHLLFLGFAGSLAGICVPACVGLIGGLRQVFAKPVEAALDHGAPVGDPALGGAEGRLVDAARARAAELARADQDARLQNLDVLQDGGQRHVQRPAELAY